MLKTHLSTCPDGFWHFPQPFGAGAPTLKEASTVWAHQSWSLLKGVLGHPQMGLVSLLCCFASTHSSDKPHPAMANVPRDTEQLSEGPLRL